ncbi:glycosyltransferase [Rhabdaerophilum sp. SD176]|uniref:glycosyltransferase family protein n=1 Tax=Rhabdaerophilum sp. SD176 TaxID=2983548 RepID=UPI0024DF3B66|nr:glycosyltransferase [Rhabdaerophilum sp. SD176]
MGHENMQARSGHSSAVSGPRVMLYSHDTFGLGHIRRTRSIANSIVGSGSDISVLIISGSPHAGSFNLGQGVDFVHIPSVLKSKSGGYGSASLHMDIREIVALRQTIILEAARIFKPDVFIADKEPTGFHSELLPTLDLLKTFGTRMVVGIRDVLDDPETVRSEWQSRGAIRAVCDYYDDIFVYGLEKFYRPLDGVLLPADVQSRITYTGYLRRSVPSGPAVIRYPKLTKGPFILVTTGGGGDGAGLIDLVLAAYEAEKTMPLPAVIVCGPYLSRSQSQEFAARVDRLRNVDMIAFDPMIERLMSRASAIVAMGGYNTFCEILSFDKPALIVPRSYPRKEQSIRAQRASELGLVRQICETGNPDLDLEQMRVELQALAERPRPSSVKLENLLEGLPRVTAELLPTLVQPRSATMGASGIRNA